MSDSAVCSHPPSQAGLVEACADVVRGWVELYRGEGIKRAQDRAAQALNLSPRRVRSWWECRVTRPDGLEVILIMDAKERLRAERMAHCRRELARLEAEEEARHVRRNGRDDIPDRLLGGLD